MSTTFMKSDSHIGVFGNIFYDNYFVKHLRTWLLLNIFDVIRLNYIPQYKDMVKTLLKRHLILTCALFALECFLQFSENFLYGVLRDLFVTK